MAVAIEALVLRRRALRRPVLLVVLAMLLLTPSRVFESRPALAATLTVTTGSDSGAGSLRDTIAAAGVGDTIVFDPSVSTVILTSGQLVVDKNLTIQGPGAGLLTVRRDPGAVTNFRVFAVMPAVTAATISGMTISGGVAPSGDEFGGGIVSSGTLTVVECVITGNRAGVSGGGIFADNIGAGSAARSLSLIRGTVSGNIAGDNGGGVALQDAVGTVVNSTVSGNSAAGAGGIFAIAAGSTVQLTVTSSTVTANTGSAAVTVIESVGRTAESWFQSSIVAGNSGGSATNKSPGATIVSLGHNLVNPVGSFPAGATDRAGSANLGPLANNGGTTPTHALLAGSPAIDAGASTVGTDQRGLPRAGAGPAADIGAFEVQPPRADLNGSAAGGDFSASFSEGGAAVPIVSTSGLTVSDADSTTITSATVTIVNPFDGAGEILGFSTAGTSVTGSYNPATSSLSLTGTRPLAEYQQVLRSVTYQNTASNPNTGTREVRFALNDGVIGGPSSTTSVTVGAVDNPPVNGVPTSATTNEDTPLVFAPANGNQISITDPDVGGGSIRVILTATNGTVTLNGTSGLTVESGANGSSTVTFTGSLAAVNTALNGLTFAPSGNYHGAASLRVQTDDLQSGVPQGPKTDDDAIPIAVASVNDLPTISNVADQTTSEATAVGPLAITVGDVETPPASLTMTGSSNNQTLVPNANIVFGGSGTNRTVTVTPAPGQSGLATITVTVQDGDGDTASDTFLLVVNAVNSAPTISNIVDQTTAEDTPLGPVAFTVGDAETAPGDLTVSATSSDPAVVPNGSILIGGSGATRTLTVTPAPNAAGPTTITVTVSDGAATTSDTFLVTVTPVNDPPTLTAIPDLRTPENTPLGPVPFTIGDAETPPASLTVRGTSSNQALVPDGSITFGGSGADRTLTVTPRAGQAGITTIAVTVSDGQGGQASDQLVLTVSDANDPPTISAIPDQSTTVGGVVGPLPFTVGDLETVPTSLTVAGSSNNLALVPTANITFGGIGTNRTVIVTPAPGQTGTATIAVTVTDSQGGQSSERFTLTVSPAPTASGCAPRPEIQTRTTVGGGALQVTILLAPSAALPNNALQTVTFGAATNAQIEVPAQAGVPAAQTGAGGFAVDLAGSVREVTFTVRRQVAGQPTTVPLVVTDACGEWRTLVGGGSQAGF